MAQVLLHPFHRPVSTCTPPLPLPSLPIYVYTCRWNKFRGNNSTIPARIGRDTRAHTHLSPPLPSPPCTRGPTKRSHLYRRGGGRREEGGGSKDPDGFGPIRAPNLFRFIAFLIHKFLFNLICRHCYGNTAWKRCISSAFSFSQPSLFYSSLSLSLSWFFLSPSFSRVDLLGPS